MATLTVQTPEKPLTPAGLLQKLWGTSWPLTVTAVTMAALFLFTVFASILDIRILTGAPLWFKPMKFAISILLYCGTLAWMLSFVEGRPRLVALVGGITTLTLLVEIVLIVMQATRGVRSHFNATTPFDATVFSIMGVFIVVAWTMNLLAAFLLLRQKFAESSFAWALRLGLLITAVGAMLGFLMTAPTSEQLAELEAGGTPQFIGAHSVGVEDGGPGLPFTGWSVEGGDVRVPHFVGLHALQAIPLVGILVNRYFANRLNARRRTALVWIAGIGYLGLTLLLLWQALRGQPLIAPDGITLAALAGLITAVVGSGTAVFITAKSHN